jgi:hypothetical protein
LQKRQAIGSNIRRLPAWSRLRDRFFQHDELKPGNRRIDIGKAGKDAVEPCRRENGASA